MNYAAMGKCGSRSGPLRTAAIVLVLALAASECGESEKKSIAPRSSPVPVRETTLGQAFVADPLAGATVKLYRSGGSLISAAGAYDEKTTEGGLFQLHPKRLPKDFTVVVSGGSQGGALFDGDVKAPVAGYNGSDDVGVNPVTSVIAASDDDHDAQSIAQTTDRVKRFLGIGPQQDLGLSLAQRDEVFSGKVFLDAANGAGGYNAFVSALAKDVEAGRPARTFAGPPKNAVPYGAILSVTLLVAKYGYCLSSSSTTVANQPVVLGCAAKTLSGGTSADPAVLAALEEINKKLDLISQQINDLGEKLNRIANTDVQLSWNKVIGALQQGYFGKINSAFTNLQNATNIKFTANDRKVFAADAISTMNSLAIDGADSSMAKLLLGEGGATGHLREFASLARQKSGRFFRQPNTVTSGGFRPDDIQNVWNYLDTYQAKLEILMVERANSHTPLPLSQTAIEETIVYPYLGKPAFVPNTNPPQPVPPSQRTGDCGAAGVTGSCRGWREQELRLVPRPLPDGVAIDTDTGLMWYAQALPQEVYDDLAKYDCRDMQPNYPCMPFDRVQRLNREPLCPGVNPYFCANPGGLNKGFTNWERPPFYSKKGAGKLGNKAVEILIKNEPPPPGTIGEWLSSAGGFFAVVNGAPVAIPKLADKRAWTSQTPSAICPKDECGADPHLVVDLGNGSESYGDAANPATKLWSLAVRVPAPCERYYYDVADPAPTTC